MVLAMLRSYQAERILVLINLGVESLEVTTTIPRKSLGHDELPEPVDLLQLSGFTPGPIQGVVSADRAALKTNLGPYEVRIMRLTPN
ncbi:MAG: hypothetical protein ACYC6L_09005 [Anaerolineae bacterium]